MFQTKVVEKIKTHISYSLTFPPKIVPFMRYCGKYGRVGPAAEDNTVHALVLLGKQGKETDTYSEYLILTAFPQQRLLRERALLLRYTHMSSLI